MGVSIVYKYNVSHGHITFTGRPLVSFLQVLHVLLLPSHPKLVSQVLGLSPPVPRVEVLWNELTRRWRKWAGLHSK